MASQRQASKADKDAASDQIAPERAKFRALLSSNPNYFGTVAESTWPVILPISNDTTFEEVDCVSLYPEQHLLEATVEVKRPTGYGGNLCQAGSREYVRFFLDYGAGWVDAGLSSIEVHDIPDGADCLKDPWHPLSYTATVQLDPAQRWCFFPVLPRARAILSWQVIPTGPNFTPVWGNVVDCHVQIKPRSPFVIDVIEQLSEINKVELKLPPELIYAEPFPLPVPDPGPLALADLAALYGAGTDAPEASAARLEVPSHRFGFADITSVTASPALSAELFTQQVEAWQAAGLSWTEALAAINEVDADTTYEELECLGLDNNVDRLVASFRIKRPSGYGGPLCQRGSVEYVAYWADWDSNCEWTYLGTSQVQVHDIQRLPDGGLCYAAPLKVDLSKQRRRCNEPRVVRVRAVLSWAVPPSTVDPDALTVWGNRIDTHVQIAPGPVITGVTPIIGFMGGIPVSHIGLVNGLTDAGAHFALLGGAVPADPGHLGRPCPFARRVAIQGPAFPGYWYRIQVKRSTDATWQTVNNPFTVWSDDGLTATVQTPVGDYFPYLPNTVNGDNVLAEWDSQGDELWDVKLDIQGVALVDQRRLQLHNTGPEASIHIDVLAGDCGKFPIGTVLAGTFVARDEYLASYGLGTLPFAAPAGLLTPVGGNVQTPVTGAPWSLTTDASMKPCGYVILVSVSSRAVYNSSPSYTSASDSAGFCLEVG